MKGIRRRQGVSHAGGDDDGCEIATMLRREDAKRRSKTQPAQSLLEEMLKKE
jgi:hypothetical protein